MRAPNKHPHPGSVQNPLCEKHGTPKEYRIETKRGRDRDGDGKVGCGWRCRACHADAELRRKARVKFGIENLPELIKSRGGRCDSCGRIPTGENRNRVLHVDHDHVTGKFRGMLCRGCNLGVGFLADDPVRCELAAAYLRRSRTGT